MYNSFATGMPADDQLDQLRKFTLNAQDKAVVKILSGTESTATLFSLPFLMIGIIIAMLVPMLVQFLGYMN